MSWSCGDMSQTGVEWDELFEFVRMEEERREEEVP